MPSDENTVTVHRKSKSPDGLVFRIDFAIFFRFVDSGFLDGDRFFHVEGRLAGWTDARRGTELVPAEDELAEETADEDQLTCSPQENSRSDKATAKMVLRDIFNPPSYALSIRARV